MHTLAIQLEPDQFLSGWRPDANLLFVPALSDARPGERVVVRISLAGHAIRATVFGRVSSVRRVGRPALPPGAELATEVASAPALQFVAAAARGEEVRFQEREPRWVAKRPLVVVRGAERVEALTANVSQRGCALEWDGPPPPPGQLLRVKVAEGVLAPAAEVVVCWSELGPRGSAIGVRLVSGGLAARAWRRMAAEVQRSGAHSV